MTQINDAMAVILGPGQQNDLLIAYYNAHNGGAPAKGHIDDAELLFLDFQGGLKSTVNDEWFALLRAAPYSFTGSLDDMKLQFWEGGGVDIPPNEFLNSAWAGGSGSIGGANWVDPTSWGNGFWPPDEAINEGVFDSVNTRLHFEAVANRGYLTQSIDGTPFIGQDINLSVFIDEVIVGQGAPIIGISGDATTIVGVGNSQTARRVSGVFNITGANITIRCGMGITSNNTAENKLSRPQFTLGDFLFAYQPT